ncbi:MAG: hypothetical protein U0Q16_10060 [Bryobacteraceae bacterium]
MTNPKTKTAVTQALHRINTEAYDPGTRLAYARLIRSHDPVRAAFIEQQVWLAQNPRSFDHPNWLPYRRSVSRAERRIARNWWPGELVEAGVTSAQFQGGFVEHIVVDAGRLIEQAEAIFACAPIRHLTLRGAKGYLSRLANLAQLARLESLDLANNDLDDRDVALIAGARCPRLRWLSLAANRITMAGVRSLAAAAGMPSLAYVDLEGNPSNPADRPSYDHGAVVDVWETAEGVAIERELGSIRWLRWNELAMARFTAGIHHRI